ncbi:hypothetical protein FF021_20390 [Leptospira noguchii]|nr:hypothetical protein FF021_20390 [Leptospira noguchii]
MSDLSFNPLPSQTKEEIRLDLCLSLLYPVSIHFLHKQRKKSKFQSDSNVIAMFQSTSFTNKGRNSIQSPN